MAGATDDGSDKGPRGWGGLRAAYGQRWGFKEAVGNRVEQGGCGGGGNQLNCLACLCPPLLIF